MESRENIAQLAKDIEYIKAAVKRNNSVLQEWANTAPTRLLMLYYGTGTIFVSLLFQYCIYQYHSFVLIPSPVKVLLFAFLAVVTISATILKYATMSRSARKMDRKLGMWPLAWKYFYHRVIHLALPITVITAGTIVYFAKFGPDRLIIGVAALYTGFFMNLFASSVDLLEYYVCGYWLLVTAVLSMLIPIIPGGIWISICFGAGFYLFFVVTAVRARRDPAKGRTTRNGNRE